jgi:hypothetical protein
MLRNRKLGSAQNISHEIKMNSLKKELCSTLKRMTALKLKKSFEQ